MATNNQIDMGAPNFLTVNSKAVERAVKRAVKAALLKHKRLNNPVAIWCDGRVVLLQPEEIYPDED